jgi:Pentapeptide repeats (8 copies)
VESYGRAGVRLGRRSEPEPDYSNKEWWTSHERKLRDKEVTSQRRVGWFQVGTTIVAVVAAGVAAFSAWQAAASIEVAEQGVRRAADETRLNTAADAIGSELPALRVAGFTLLSRHATQRLESANEGDATGSERRDALRLFRGAFDILVNYLINPAASSASETSLQPTNPEPAQRGVGDPNLPRDFHYAAGRLHELIQHKADYLKLSRAEGDPSRPTVDLANTILYGVRWRGTDFSWLEARYLLGADLRRAKLTDSGWRGATFTDGFMQCAQLQGAHLEGAHLENVHLEGAYLQGAHLHGAHLQGAHLQGAHFTGADIKRADFGDAKLENRELDEAKNRDKALNIPNAALPDDARSDLAC